MITYFPTAGDRHGWAIDEDLRLIGAALVGVARKTSLGAAEVVHSPFWAALAMHSPEALARRFVIAHADNPPFFYLTQPEFARAQGQVDLWVARSQEAHGQFQQLRLPTVHIPYAIDEGLFFPLSNRGMIRQSLGLPEGAYVIGNFHRDSEGSDLSKPKFQKAPELLVQICRRLRAAGAPIHVLLAGPRRHWIREALTVQQIPFTFVGRECAGDDFGINILPREELNRLYNACDLYLIPSRWEGGPQSVMEAAAARVRILSIPLGVGRDILEPESLFHTVPDAVATILEDIRERVLERTIEPQFRKWQTNHTSARMQTGLRDLYARLPEDSVFRSKVRPSLLDFVSEALHCVRRRLGTGRLPKKIFLCGDFNEDGVPDVPGVLRHWGVEISGEASLRLAGKVSNPGDYAGRIGFQFLRDGLDIGNAIPGACVIVPSVQEAVNLREGGADNAVLVCPPEIARGEVSDEPFVVGEGDLGASMGIGQAMQEGRPVVYPEDSASYYQVFHGGVPYGKIRPKEGAVALARQETAELRALTGEAGSVEIFLKRLLKC